MAAMWTDDSKTKAAVLNFKRADYAAPSWIDQNSRRRAIAPFITGALLIALACFAIVGIVDTLQRMLR